MFSISLLVFCLEQPLVLVTGVQADRLCDIWVGMLRFWELGWPLGCRVPLCPLMEQRASARVVIWDMVIGDGGLLTQWAGSEEMLGVCGSG